MSTVNDYPHLEVDAAGAAWVADSRYKVSHLAAEHYCYGWTAEELLRQHPDLRPEQVYAALAYFYDHYDEVVASLQASAAETAVARNLQSLSRANLLARKGGGRG